MASDIHRFSEQCVCFFFSLFASSLIVDPLLDRRALDIQWSNLFDGTAISLRQSHPIHDFLYFFRLMPSPSVADRPLAPTCYFYVVFFFLRPVSPSPSTFLPFYATRERDEKKWKQRGPSFPLLVARGTRYKHTRVVVRILALVRRVGCMGAR